MKKLRVTLIAIIFLTSTSCEEAFDQETDESGEILLVVEARFTSERIRQEVKLSFTFDEINEEPPPVTNALVAINDGDSTFILSHNASRPGIYLTDTLRALFGKVYTLYILHEEKEYFAFATSAFGTQLPALTIQEIDTGIFEFVYDEPISSMTEVQITWEEDSVGQTIERKKEAFFYTLDVIDVNKTFAPEKEPLIFPKGATIYRKKYSLTKEHQDFLRSFLSEVDWRGGFFDVAAGNVFTNLSDGAVGYFSVSMVVIDSTLVK